MDIISMQIANKVIKRMNREYNGILETVVAAEGQTEVSIAKDFGTTGHTLEIHVDGIKAIEGKDFAIKDSKTIVFSEPLQKGNVVAFSTSVTGIPKFLVSNPPYNDNELRTKIDSILNAIDDDKNGSIVDNINNFKSQWQSLDGSLKKVIEDKVSKATVEAVLAEIETARSGKTNLKETLDEILALIPASYNDSVVKADIKTLQHDLGVATNELSLSKTDITNIKTQIGTANTDISDLKIKVDKINDAKKQLESTTDNIQTQVYSKADKVDVTVVTDKVNKLEITIAGKASDESLTQLTSKVIAIEEKKIEDFEIIDSVTGTKYRLKVSNGSLTIESINPIVPPQTEKPAETPNTKPTENTVSN